MGASTQLADGIVRVFGDPTAQRLHWVTRTPLRRPVIELIFWQIPKHLDCERAADVEGSIRWHINAGAGHVYTYDLVLEHGSCRVRRGLSESEPKVTVTVDDDEFLRLVTGNSDPMQAYFKRRLTMSGDIMFAAKLLSLFRIPKRQ